MSMCFILIKVASSHVVLSYHVLSQLIVANLSSYLNPIHSSAGLAQASLWVDIRAIQTHFKKPRFSKKRKLKT